MLLEMIIMALFPMRGLYHGINYHVNIWKKNASKNKVIVGVAALGDPQWL